MAFVRHFGPLEPSLARELPPPYPQMLGGVPSGCWMVVLLAPLKANWTTAARRVSLSLSLDSKLNSPIDILSLSLRCSWLSVGVSRPSDL
jgi:hypothetical protein